MTTVLRVIGIGVAAGAALWIFRLNSADQSGVKRETSRASNSGRVTKAEAERLLGLTESQLRARFGAPSEVTESDSPDGPFKMLKYDQRKGSETFFVIFRDDGIVQSGMYQGTLFYARQ